jgi:hypothetical protein
MAIALRPPLAPRLTLFAAGLAMFSCGPSQAVARPEPTPSLDGTWAIARYESSHPLRGETGIAPLLAMSVTFELRGTEITRGSALDASRDLGAANGAWLATVDRAGSSIALAAAPGSEFSWLFDRGRGSVGPDWLVWETPGARLTMVRAMAVPRPATLCASRDGRVFARRARCRADEHSID